ncbi:MAG: tRNA lysidine(34) synthetase TilS [Candidatus Egerieousia sp.]
MGNISSGKRQLKATAFEQNALDELRRLCQSDNVHNLKLLLAVSGGVDSLVMATIAAKLFENAAWRIAIAHVNFHLRGTASDEDELFVKKWGETKGIKVFSTEFDTANIAKERGISVEMAARDLRYEWFYSIALKHDFTHLAIAHNANDNAETLLLNLVRGTGYSGLKGILRKRSVEIGEDRKLEIIRPLLWAQRADIEDYAQNNNMVWRTDHTNNCNDYSRNKIRNAVIPLLSSINPSIVSTLNKEAARFAEAGKILDGIVDKEENRLKTNSIPGVDYLGLRKRHLVTAFDIAAMSTDNDNTDSERRQSDFLLESVLRKYGINSSTTEDIIGAIKSLGEEKKKMSQSESSLSKISFTTKIFKSADFIAVLERGMLKIYSTPDFDGFTPITIYGEGTYRFGDFCLEIRIDEYAAHLSAETIDGIKTNTIHSAISRLDADKIKFPLICRISRPGDKFRPFGMRGKKNVADFLNSRKIDVLFKGIIPVLQEEQEPMSDTPQNHRPNNNQCIKQEGRIIAIPGIEVSEEVRITSSTRHILSIAVYFL